MKPVKVKTHLDLFKGMLKIRRLSEMIADRYGEQEMKCPTHLSIGQEAVSVASCAFLSSDDHVYAGHRCHAPYLAKGGNVRKMIAELYGRSTGCAKGRGGSMHLVDAEVGMMGASALIAGTIPIAVGSALAFKMTNQPNVAIAYFGDGACEAGQLWESLNFAALKKLPVIFICENNQYATYSHVSNRQAALENWKKAETFGMPAYAGDGNDVVACANLLGPAIERARKGEGPSFFEFQTMRWRDHVGPNYDYNLGYRTKEEVEAWMAKCPIEKLKKQLLASGELTPQMLQKIEDDLQAECKDAFEFALKSPFPETSEIFSDVY